jgi:hypothetical protein
MQGRIAPVLPTVKMEDFDETVTASTLMSAIGKNFGQILQLIQRDRSAIYVSNTLEEAEKIYGLMIPLDWCFGS